MDKNGKSTIILIEDDIVVRRALHSLFDRGTGFDACVDTRNRAAVAEAQQRSPDLAILGFPMAESNGLLLYTVVVGHTHGSSTILALIEPLTCRAVKFRNPTSQPYLLDMQYGLF